MIQTQINLTSRQVGMEGKKNKVFSGIPTVSASVISSLSVPNTMTKSINIINNPGQSTPSVISSSNIGGGTNLGPMAASPPITINITNMTPLTQSSNSTLSSQSNASAASFSNDNSNKLIQSSASSTYQGQVNTSVSASVPSSNIRPASISIGTVATTPASSNSPVGSCGSSVVVATPVLNTTAPPMLSHVHIPRGAAVVANMAGSRTSLAVTASAAQRVGAALPNRGIHLSSGNWGRVNNNNASANTTIITCGSVSNISSSIITTIPTTSSAIATTKFTRLPGSQLSPRQGAIVTTSNSSSCNIIRPTSITRVTSTTSLINSNPGGNIIRNIPTTTTGAGMGVTSRAALNTSSTTSLTRPSGVTAAVGVSSGTTRTVLTPNRTQTTTVRPPSMSTSTILNPPIRLTQTTLGPAQRAPSVTSYALTSVQRPLAQGAAPSVTNIRARTSSSTPRFSGNQITTPVLPNRTNFSSSPVVSSSALPSRPQSNPGLPSASRPVLCATRPASTGPASPSLQAVRSTGLGRGFTGSSSTSGTFVRATEGAMTVRPVLTEVRTAASVTARQQPQQYMQMTNSSNMQKVSCLTSNTNVSVVGGGRSNFPSASSPGAAPIAVRITPSPGSQTGNNNSSRTIRATEHLASATTIVTGVVAGGVTKVLSAATGSAGCAAASAAAAVLPPGTTITPAVLPPPPPHHQQQQEVTPSVYIQRTPAVMGNPHTIGQQASPQQQQYFVDSKTTQITVGNSNPNGSLMRCTSASNNNSSGRRLLTDTNTTTVLVPTAATAALSQSGPAGNTSATPANKPQASPRPSILRKRPDYDTSSASASKACKNLSGALSSAGGNNGGSSSGSCPASPKRPDSRGGNSGASTGSATLSADSSPAGLQIEEGEVSEESRPATAVAPLADGISPRKKPRKQQLTGNELQDAQHTSDDDERSSGRPCKKPRREFDMEEYEPTSWPCDGSIPGALPSPRPLRHRHLLSTTQPISATKRHLSSHSNNNFSKFPQRFNVRGTNTNSPLNNNGCNGTASNAGLSSNNLLPNACHNNGTSSHNNNIAHNNYQSAGSNNLSMPLPLSSTGYSNNHNISNDHHQANNGSSTRAAAAEDSCGSSNSSPEKPERKHMSLLDSYRRTWKARNNHFVRHCDVKVKEDKRSNNNSLSGNKLSLQKLEGWKIVHVGGQVTDLVEVEKEVSSHLNDILATLELKSKNSSKGISKDIDQVCELIKANEQRSKIIHDQMREARNNMDKLLEHKGKVGQLMSKYSGRRQLRKKDKRSIL